jgi:hypothetical protein
MVGTCAVCGDPVCTECYSPIFTAVICANHEGLEDENEWELIGVYATAGPVENVRFLFDDHGLLSLAMENDDGLMEVYVPVSEKDDAWATMDDGEADDMSRCEDCQVVFTLEMSECPVCGKESEVS